MFPECSYVGFDCYADTNTDVVGDAHNYQFFRCNLRPFFFGGSEILRCRGWSRGITSIEVGGLVLLFRLKDHGISGVTALRISFPVGF